MCNWWSRKKGKTKYILENAYDFSRSYENYTSMDPRTLISFNQHKYEKGTSRLFIIKLLKIGDTINISKASRDKEHIVFRGIKTKIAADLSSETM